jgi:predicted PurR-regulated permease PerM
LTVNRTTALVLLAIAATIALVIVLYVVWQAIFWAVVLGILFRPIQKWVEARFSLRPGVAAAVTLLLTLVFVQIPIFVLGSMIVTEGAAVYQRIESSQFDLGATLGWLQQLVPQQVWQWLAGLGVDFGAITERIQTAVMRGGQFALSLLVGAGQNAASFVMNFFLMVYLLYFILRDGDEMYRKLFAVIPLPSDQKQRLFAKFAEVSIATLKGTLVVGVTQGALGGLIFFLLGINGAVFWGAAMAVVSVLPAVGAALVWVPAALFLILGGSWIKGAILLAFGTLVISMSDNVLRPVVVGRQTRMPDYLVLFSTIGGLAVLGISGFVLGPVIAAVFLVSWELVAEERTGDERGSIISASGSTEADRHL